MGFLRNILGMFDKKVMAIEVIDRQKNSFHRYKASYPNKHLHYWLAKTRPSRIAGLNFRAGEDPQMVMRAAAETLMLACMPEEKAVRALGLYTLHFERPDIIHESPELNTEFTSSIGNLLLRI